MAESDEELFDNGRTVRIKHGPSRGISRDLAGSRGSVVI